MQVGEGLGGEQGLDCISYSRGEFLHYWFSSRLDNAPCTGLELRDLVRLGDYIDKMSSDESDLILSPAVLAQPPTNQILDLSRLVSSHVCRNCGEAGFVNKTADLNRSQVQLYLSKPDGHLF